MKENKEFLYNDFATYQSFKSKEEKVFDIFNELKDLSVKALGNAEVDFELYLYDPSNYLVDMYWELYTPAAEHLKVNKEQIFQHHTNITVMHLNKLNNEFKQALKAMQGKEPKINKGGLKSTLSKDQHNKYLDPKKADKYKALVKFVESANELKKYENTQGIHLIRYCNSLRFENADVVINMHDFAL